jgi:prolyl oligopeptidase PreP (S9A serine peptidase family)
MCVASLDILVKQLDAQGRRELNLKLKLEQQLKPEISPIFRRIVSDFRILYAQTGRAVNVEQYKPQFETVLNNHYRRVQKAFTGQVEASNGGKSFVRYEMKQEENENVEALILAALIAWRNETAPRKAEFITETNDIQMQKAIETARRDLAEQGEDTSNAAVAAAAAVILQRLYDSRVERIIVTETQESAESTKEIEASALSGMVPQPAEGLPGVVAVLPFIETSKIWNSLLDGRERTSHRQANGQRVPVNGTFIIGPSASRLRYPGDTGLGAVVQEVVNCRCYNEYRLGLR